ncbi:hypothetical protein L7F22_007229 [Adiantum nelumboides]|nr:hypothetical protein [Adiantum nelumboides]
MELQRLRHDVLVEAMAIRRNARLVDEVDVLTSFAHLAVERRLTGSFVPCESARIGLVDGLFSRVGARDDVARDRSTFMVEMAETSEILKRATKRSLVIADEIGRGTTTDVGVSIALATLRTLLEKNGCRTLFATHLHEIADLLSKRHEQSPGEEEGVKFVCTDVDEDESDGSIIFSHRLRDGINRESHGLKVAKLAGMPEEALAVAEKDTGVAQGSPAALTSVIIRYSPQLYHFRPLLFRRQSKLRRRCFPISSIALQDPARTSLELIWLVLQLHLVSDVPVFDCYCEAYEEIVSWNFVALHFIGSSR